MSDTILVDGVDLESELRHIRFAGWGDVHTAAGLAGSNYSSPLRDGEVWRKKRRSPTVVPLSFAITPDGADVDELMASANAEWFKLLRLFPRRRPVTLTRRLAVATEYGVQTVEMETSAERVQEVAPNWVAHSYQDGVLMVRNLHGAWFDVNNRVYTITPGEAHYLPATGTTDTASISITLSGGTGIQTLENHSAGVWLQYNWAGIDPASVVTVDVVGFKVLRTAAGVTVGSLSRFSHGGENRFMIIDPDMGDNEFTLNQGQAVVTYREAYL